MGDDSEALEGELPVRYAFSVYKLNSTPLRFTFKRFGGPYELHIGAFYGLKAPDDLRDQIELKNYLEIATRSKQFESTEVLKTTEGEEEVKHLNVEDMGTTLNLAIVKAGLAKVDDQCDPNNPIIVELLAAQEISRTHRVGLWNPVVIDE
eukprot:TRINITY_DN9107_c0_g1_i1.p1 TRINITY_DN9107_c0_g1~~TRINITY_DN9107_c0_g1_i1.p1  ORF type:complete len:150 (-),score=20.22 TRINITY_DN9107_c0_g1_i1:68-517(-)